MFGVAAICAIAMLLSIMRGQPTHSVDFAENQAEASRPVLNDFPIENDVKTQYLFDVYGHSPEEVRALLMRAKYVYDNLSADLRNGLQIAMVLHGPDVEYFATENYTQHGPLVDLAASLDALGFVDLKVCVGSIRAAGLDSSTFPPFIELMPYGPT